MAAQDSGNALHTALAELGRRRSRLSTGIALALIVPSVLLVPLVYLVIRELQFRLWRFNIPSLSAAIAIALTVPPGIWLARRLGALALRSRRSRWIQEVSCTHGLASHSVDEFLEAD